MEYQSLSNSSTLALLLLLGWLVAIAVGVYRETKPVTGRRQILIKRSPAVSESVPPNASKVFNTYSELRDLCFHMDRVARSIGNGLYQPNDKDFLELAGQLMGLSNQLRTFMKNKKCEGSNEQP